MSEAKQIKRDIEVLKAANTDTNNRMRRNNFLFLGIHDAEKETWQESEQKIVKLCSETLKLELDGNAIERAHRLGSFGGGKKRPIIVKLTHFKAKDSILACGRQLKGTNYAIREDFAPATRQARFKLLQFVRPQKCAFKFTLDKLHVGNKTYFYDVATDAVLECANTSTIAPTPLNSRVNSEASAK